MSADSEQSLDARLSAVESSIDSLNGRMDRLDERIETRFDRLDGRITEVNQNLDTRIDDRFDKLDGKINDVDGKIDSESRAIRQDLHRSMYRLFAAMTLVFVVVSVVVQVAL